MRWTLLLLGLVALVYAPLRSAMPVGDAPRVLATVASSSGGDGMRELFGLARDGVGPLGAASLALSDRMWRGDGTWEGGALAMLRAENLVLHLLAALGLGFFVRRLLEPWTSRDHAYAAGLAATFLFALHPFAPSAVVSPASRGDLLAAALVLLASAAFLRGRQRREPRLVTLSALAVLVAGLASELAWLVAPLLALAELVSARRSRAPGARQRTALTTLLVFGALSGSGMLLALVLGLDPVPPRLRAGLAMFDSWGGAWDGFALGLERFGLLLFPINARGTGLFDFVALGLLLLLVLHPALGAARAAPRLWSTVLLGWFAGMLLAQVSVADLRVHPNDWTHARQLLAGAAVMSAGLAIAATAVSGRRRVVVPVLVVLGLGLLARADSDCQNRAGRPARRLQSDLVEALQRFSSARHLFVVDPPGLVRAHLSVAPDLGWLVHESLVGEAAPPGGTRLRGLGADALRDLLLLPESDALREQGWVVDLPFAALGLDRPLGERTALLLAPSSGELGLRAWQNTGESPLLELDASAAKSLLASPPPGRPLVLPPLMRWRASGDPALPAGLEGTWIAGKAGPVAVFDLGRSLAWSFAGTVERIWLEGGVADPAEARLEPALPVLLGAEEPRVRGDDWVFELDAEAPTPFGLDQTFVLSLLDLASLRRVQIPAYLTADGELVAEDVEPLVRRMRRADGGALSWSLEHRAAGRAIARVGGRR